MSTQDLIAHLISTGWTESTVDCHYIRKNTKGLVAIDSATDEAFIVEFVGSIPWARAASIEQFERDLASLQD